MTNPTYATDLTDDQWQLIKQLLPAAKAGGRPRKVCLRAVFNALLYVLVGGAAWRLLPLDYPHWRTAYGYLRAWQDDGTWQRVHDELRAQVRREAGHHKHATAGSIDSQTVGMRGGRGVRGYDGAKRRVGRKRHLCVDTLGLLIHVVVTPANISDTAGAGATAGLAAAWARLGLKAEAVKLRLLWVDAGYFNAAKDKARAQRLELRVVERPAGRKGFALLPRRWVVERTFAWLGKCRRLVRDYETTLQASTAFIRLAMIRLMINRLHKPFSN